MKRRGAYGVYGRVGPAKGFTWAEVRCTDGTLPLDLAARRRYRKQGRNLNRLRLAVAKRYGVRAYDDVSIVVNSWYRSPDYNRRIGGASASLHLTGKATDIQVIVRTRGGKRVKLAPSFVALLAARHVPAFNKGGIGTYRTFTHLDHRGWVARWKG